MTGLHRRAVRYLGLAMCVWLLALLSACGGGGDLAHDDTADRLQTPKRCQDIKEC